MSYRVIHERLPGFWVPLELESPVEAHIVHGGAAYEGAVPAGEYYSPRGLLDALELALESAQDSGGADPGIVVDIEPAPLAQGRLRVRSSLPMTIPGAVENAGLRALLGAVGSVEAGAEWAVMPDLSSQLWVSEQPVAIDEGDELDREAVETRALSGYRQRTVLSPIRRLRNVRIDWLTKEGIDAFRDRVWMHGERVTYLPDAEVWEGNEYVIVEPLGRFEPARHNDKQAQYALRVELERLVEP